MGQPGISGLPGVLTEGPKGDRGPQGQPGLPGKRIGRKFKIHIRQSYQADNVLYTIMTIRVFFFFVHCKMN